MTSYRPCPARSAAATTRYTAESHPLTSPTLDTFLFGNKLGYCQQFSGAMALLLRMGGVPARVASGFAPGSYDRKRKEYVVRDLDAHSWVEAYFPGYGWVPFDPTPAIAPARSQASNDVGAERIGPATPPTRVDTGAGLPPDAGSPSDPQRFCPDRWRRGFPGRSPVLAVVVLVIAILAVGRPLRAGPAARAVAARRPRWPSSSARCDGPGAAPRRTERPCAVPRAPASLALPGAGAYLRALRARTASPYSAPAPTPAGAAGGAPAAPLARGPAVSRGPAHAPPLRPSWPPRPRLH